MTKLGKHESRAILGGAVNFIEVSLFGPDSLFKERLDSLDLDKEGKTICVLAYCLDKQIKSMEALKELDEVIKNLILGKTEGTMH